MDTDHPALVAARNSWRCVMNKDKEAWLALMADDVCVEDPIGLAPTTAPAFPWSKKSRCQLHWKPPA